MAAERDLEKSDFNMSNNIIFDVTGHFLLYPTVIGIKVINIETNRCVNILGKTDNIRPLHIALFQGKGKKSKAAITLEQEASENPALQSTTNDPTLFCTAYKWVIVLQFNLPKKIINVFVSSQKTTVLFI